MNKTIYLLVLSLMTLTSVMASSITSRQVETPVVREWYSFITNWINNQWYYLMRIQYDIFCFYLGWIYIFWFNDGGANFYKCYRSVPKNIKFLY